MFDNSTLKSIKARLCPQRKAESSGAGGEGGGRGAREGVLDLTMVVTLEKMN